MRTRRKHYPRITAGVAAIALLLAACGGDGDDTAADDVTDSDAADDGGDDQDDQDDQDGEDGNGDAAAGDELPIFEGLNDEERTHLEELIEEARAEGELHLNWTDFDHLVMGWAEGFNETYGLETNVIHSPAASGSGAAVQMSEEYNAGRTSHSDILEGRQVRMHLAVQDTEDGYLPYPWQLLPHITEEMLTGAPSYVPVETDREGYLAVSYRHVIPGIAYNTNTVDEADLPATTQDIIDGALEGYAMASTPNASNFESLFADDVLGYDQACAFTQYVGQNAEGLIGTEEISRIATGEFDVMVLDSGDRLREIQEDGGPIALHLLEDFLVIRPSLLMVPEHAANPATARLWVDYMNSPAVQQDLRDNAGGLDSIWVEDSLMRAEIDQTLESAGMSIDSVLSLDLEFMEEVFEDQIEPIEELTYDLIQATSGTEC